MVNTLFVKVKCLNKTTKFRDWLSSNDLFVLIKYGDQKRRTTVKWNQDAPIWDESFIFEITTEKNLIFSIYDEDAWSKSDKVQEYAVPIKTGEIKKYKTKFLEVEMGDPNYQKNKAISELEKKKLQLEKDNKTNETQIKNQSEIISKLSNELEELRKKVEKKCETEKESIDLMEEAVQRLKDSIELVGT